VEAAAGHAEVQWPVFTSAVDEIRAQVEVVAAETARRSADARQALEAGLEQKLLALQETLTARMR
jgi:hypothetical protein